MLKGHNLKPVSVPEICAGKEKISPRNGNVIGGLHDIKRVIYFNGQPPAASMSLSIAAISRPVSASAAMRRG